jgi:hypothetical protein
MRLLRRHQRVSDGRAASLVLSIFLVAVSTM